MTLPHLETKDLLIRPYTKGDEHHILEVLRTNRNYLKAVLSEWVYAIDDLQGTQRFIDKMKVGAMLKKMFAFGVWTKQEEQLAGEVMLFNIQKEKAEIGCYTTQSQRGRGIATQANIACAKYAFERLAVKMIVAHCETSNAASIHVYKKIGFAEAGQTNKGYLRLVMKFDDFNPGL